MPQTQTQTSWNQSNHGMNLEVHRARLPKEGHTYYVASWIKHHDRYKVNGLSFMLVHEHQSFFFFYFLQFEVNKG